ncbi:13068_t:CDS:2, partial [Acaulospora colombiana]
MYWRGNDSIACPGAFHSRYENLEVYQAEVSLPEELYPFATSGRSLPLVEIDEDPLLSHIRYSVSLEEKEYGLVTFGEVVVGRKVCDVE